MVCAPFELVNNDDTNSAKFLKWAQDEFARPKFKNKMSKAIDDKVAMAAHDNIFKLHHQRPQTAKNVYDTLFSTEIMTMIHDGRSNMVMAYLVSWINCLLFQSRIDDWVKLALSDYFQLNDIRVILGDPNDNDTRQHCMVRLEKQLHQTASQRHCVLLEYNCGGAHWK